MGQRQMADVSTHLCFARPLAVPHLPRENAQAKNRIVSSSLVQPPRRTVHTKQAAQWSLSSPGHPLCLQTSKRRKQGRNTRPRPLYPTSTTECVDTPTMRTGIHVRTLRRQPTHEESAGHARERECWAVSAARRASTSDAAERGRRGRRSRPPACAGEAGPSLIPPSYPSTQTGAFPTEHRS